MAKEYKVSTKKVGRFGRWITIKVDGLFVTIYTFETRRPSVYICDTRAKRTSIKELDDKYNAVTVDFA